MIRIAVILVLALVIAGLIGAATRAPFPKRPRHPDTVAHCLIGELGPGRVSRFEPCQNRELYGRI